jgi:hypothetical protein
VSLAEDELFRLDYGPGEKQLRVRGFDCDGLATAVFLANLLDHIAVLRGRPEADISLFAEECPRWTLQNRPFVDGSKPAITAQRPRQVIESIALLFFLD